MKKVYPPSGPSFFWQLAKLAVFFVFLLLLAGSYRVFRDISVPFFLQDLLGLSALGVVLWVYSVEKYWVFLWGNERLTVYSGFNGVLRRWAIVKLRDEVVMRYASWWPVPELLRQQIRYGGKVSELELSISTSGAPGNVVCGVTIDGEPLEGEASSQDSEERR